MKYVIIAILFILVLLAICLISNYRIKNLKNKNERLADQLGQRNKIINDYIGKYFEIVQIIKKDTKSNEFAVITVNKIKEVIFKENS